MAGSLRAAAGGRGPLWSRLVAATVLAYVAGFLIEAAQGDPNPLTVGWSSSFAPVLAEGAVVGFWVGGVWGAVLAPVPLLVAPETWLRLARLWDVMGPRGLLILAHPLPAMWAAGVIGAAMRRLVRWPGAR